MASVFDCANFFIDIANSTDDDNMTNMKVNKLLYYAQGTHLARTGKPLFKEAIKAWEHGPVIPQVYNKYSVCGRQPIEQADEGYSSQVFTCDELSTLLDVMSEFGKYTGSTLRKMTHENGTPWANAYVKDKSNVIPLRTIRLFFQEHPVKKWEPSTDIPHVKVLPKELYNPEEDAIWESCR